MTTRTIPASPADVTSSWLASVLSTDRRQVTIRDVTVTPVGTGQTGATYRAAPVYDADAAGLPDTFIVKLPSQYPAVRERVALGYQSEHAFYTTVAATVKLPMPHCYHCEIANGGTDFVLLLDDLAPAVQGDQIEGCNVAEARLAAEALSGLHGPRWCDPAWLTFTGATMPQADAAFADGLGQIARMAADKTLDKLGPSMTEADRSTLVESMGLVAEWLLAEPERFALLHGDYRLDNLLFDPARTRVMVVDWQTLAVGLPARDLAYFLATSLRPELRADAERGLVGDYHRALLGYGVADYHLETCWQDYRLGMLQVPLITTLGFAFSAETDRGDDMALTMLSRGCQAIRELNTLDLIRAKS